MVFSSVFATARSVTGLVAAVLAVFGSNPALANSSANAADVTAPLRAAQEARPQAMGSGDEVFRQLHASWRSLDNSAGFAAAATPVAPRTSSVARASIPSRMPVDGVRLSSSFGMREHPVLGGRRAHKGVDLAAPTGTPIYATADGVVEKAEWFSGYGLYVQLDHGAALETRYGHMSRLNVASGQRVRKGDVIGYVGSTGRSTGPHLHYEVRIAGEAMNPIPYMQAGEFLALAEGGRGGPEE